MMRNFFIYPWNWVILIVGSVLLVAAIVYLARRSGRREPGNGEFPAASPLDILKERYARGEISREEFERTKKDL